MAHTGYAGTAHDSRVMSGSPIALKPQEKLSNEEYVLADSAYGQTKHVIPVIKRNKNRELNKDERNFNFYHARARVNIENCIGMLKGLFPSLRGMRLPIEGKKDVAKASMWIHTCCILHNFLLAMNDKVDRSWVSERVASFVDDDSDSEDEEDIVLRQERTRALLEANTPEEKRLVLRRILKEFYQE